MVRGAPTVERAAGTTGDDSVGGMRRPAVGWDRFERRAEGRGAASAAARMGVHCGATAALPAHASAGHLGTDFKAQVGRG